MATAKKSAKKAKTLPPWMGAAKAGAKAAPFGAKKAAPFGKKVAGKKKGKK